jgi:predicted benzoate:H+ symporter BenE
MVDVEARHLIPAGFVILIGYGATLYLAKRLHKLITGKSEKDNKPRWFAANAAGIVFVLFGSVWSPQIIGLLSRYFSGVDGDPSKAMGLIFLMVVVSSIGAAIGFGLGKLRMPAKSE